MRIVTETVQRIDTVLSLYRGLHFSMQIPCNHSSGEMFINVCVNNTLDALRKMKVMLLEAADVTERLIRHLPLATLLLLDFISGHSVSLAEGTVCRLDLVLVNFHHFSAIPALSSYAFLGTVDPAVQGTHFSEFCGFIFCGSQRSRSDPVLAGIKS